MNDKDFVSVLERDLGWGHSSGSLAQAGPCVAEDALDLIPLPLLRVSG